MFNFLKKKQPIIKFYTHPDSVGVIPPPTAANKCIPHWFKGIKPTIPREYDEDGKITESGFQDQPGWTIKRCMPVMDVMSLGYVIPLAGDLGVITNGDCSEINISNPRNMKVAEFHSIEQFGGKNAPGYPAKPIKFINQWVVRTRPGWSTLFLPLINDFNETRFTCLGGLVDTDTYWKTVNFPAVWHQENFDDFVYAGTPLVVAIPIERAAMPKEPLITLETEEERTMMETIHKQQQSRVRVYTDELRDKR